MPKIAIIGAGLSGLTTAYALHRLLANCDSNSASKSAAETSITLLESSNRIGGVITTESVGPFLIDHGADMFATNPPAAMELCQQLGLADQLQEPQASNRGARIYFKGKLIPIPEGFVLMRATKTWPMLTTPLLPLAAKVRFLAERFCRKGRHDQDFDESVGEFVSRRMGPAVLNRIVAPLAAGIYTADVHRLSMRSTMGPIHQMERDYGSLHAASKRRAKSGEDSVERTSTGARYGQFRALPGGMVQLIDTLSRQLPENCIRLNTAVTSVEKVNDRWRLDMADDAAEEFDRVVIAAPAKPAARMLRRSSSTAAETLDSIQSASTAIIVLGVGRDQIKNDVATFGFVVPLSEGKQILAGSFASHKFAGRAPDDRVLIRCFVGGMLNPNILERSDDELIEIVQAELEEMIGLSGSPQLAKVVRWPDAMPQYEVGHHRKVAKIESEINRLPNLWLNNNALHGVGIAPLIRQAQQTANSIFESLQSEPS